jgi:hypothetical protein
VQYGLQSRRVSFPIPGFGIGVDGIPGSRSTNAHTTRDSNPGPIFSIPGSGIETFLMPTSRRDYVTTHDYYNNHICESHIVHNSHTDGCGICVVGWYCYILDAKHLRKKELKKLNNVRQKCNCMHSTVSPYCTAYMTAVINSKI